MGGRNWVVGAKPDCDIVIDKPTVSGYHCRLEEVDGILFIEDLHSTNGTFVNGNRISKRTIVGVDDVVTLGQAVPLPLPGTGQSLKHQKRDGSILVTIGRDRRCNLVIDHPKLSSQHALLSITDGIIQLKDLGSTNGTFLHAKDNRIQQETVKPGDKVWFGTYHTTVATLMDEADIPASYFADLAVSTAAPTSQLADSRTLAIGGGIAALLLVAVITGLIWALSGNTTPPPTPPSIADVDTTPGNGGVITPPTTPEPIPSPPEPTPVVDKQKAVWVLAVADEEAKTPLRIGSAVAIGPHTLLTAATCKTIRDLTSEKLPKLLLLGPAQLTIEEFASHPEYELAFAEGDEAEARFIDVYDKTMSAEQTPELKAALDEAFRQYMIISEKAHHFDIAVIQVAEELPVYLNLADKASLAPLSRVGLLGHGFDRVAPFHPLGDPLEIATETGRVQSTSGSTDSRMVTVKLETVDPETHRDLSYVGCPILDTRGSVVAVYSRVTPSDSLDEAPSGDSFDAAVVPDLLPFIRKYTDN